MSKEEKYGFVYIWYDNAKSKLHIDERIKRFYIGCHWGREDDGYICSSRWMRKSFRKRPNDFKRRIISRIYTSRKDLHEEEHKWLSLIPKNELSKRYYNLREKTIFSKGTTGKHFSEESKKKMSESHKGQRPWMTGKKHTEETKRKISEVQIGKKASNETKEKMSESRKGENHPLYGKHHSDEAKEKMRQAHLGKKASNETKEKMSGRIPWNKGKIKINGCWIKELEFNK